MWSNRLPLGAQNLGEGPAKATMAKWVEERVDGRVEPKEPESDFVPVMFHTSATAGSPYDHKEGVRCPTHPKNTHYDCQGLGNLLISREACLSSAFARGACIWCFLRSYYARPYPTTQQSSFLHGRLHCQRHGVGATGISAGWRWNLLVVFDHGRNSRRPAGGHLARFDEEDRRGLSVDDPPAVLLLSLHVCHATPVPPLNVEIDAEVEEGHGDERWEELEGRRREQEVPGAVELGETFVLWNDAFSDHQFPEDDSWTVEEECQNPHRQHLDHCQTSDTLLGSVPHLRNKAHRRR